VDIGDSVFGGGGIRGVDVIPGSLEFFPWHRDLVINVWFITFQVIGRESISWFRDGFLFNIVNSKRSVSTFLRLGPITVFRDTS